VEGRQPGGDPGPAFGWPRDPRRHPSLTPAPAIPLTLRAVGGLTTREIAAAFLVPEATMGQRISRAKAKIKASGEPFTLPPPDQWPERLRLILHVLYLIFNEGYTSSSGPDLARTDLSGEAIRLARGIHGAAPEDSEIAGLLALMLLTDARRPARSGAGGELIPLAEQDRTLWDRRLIIEGIGLITQALRQGELGEYQVQAAIAALHDQAASHAVTDWPEILSLYGWLEAMTGNPMMRLNRAVAAPWPAGRTRASTAWASGSATITGCTRCEPTSSSRPATPRPPSPSSGPRRPAPPTSVNSST
jgi:predicted RNA polymerase sigma factor